jgi:DNA-binding IclR family transcriptional regulator
VLRQFTANTITNFDDLERELDKVRAQGFAVDHGERTPNWYFVAVPVRGRDGKVIAAIVAGGSETVLPPEKLEWLPREMHMAADQLSVRMGYLEE